MPRKYYPDHFLARLPEGTIERMHSMLAYGEKPADFVRSAIGEKLDRRENPDSAQYVGSARVTDRQAQEG